MADELLLEVGLGSGDWANISDRIYDRSEITIVRGLQSEDGTAGPSSLNLTLKNDDGVFAVRNPTSPLWGKLGRNAALRLSYGRGGRKGLVLGQGLNSTRGIAFCSDSAGLSSGDLDLRLDLQFLQRADGAAGGWLSGSHDLASHFDFFVNFLDWSFMVVNGVLRLRWFPLGTTPGLSADAAVNMSARVAEGTDRCAVRVTLDLDNGSGGNTVTFYTAPTLAGPWTVLGAPVTQAGVTSRWNSSSALRIGAGSQTGAAPWIIGTSDPVVHYAAEVRQGIGGTVVASPDFAGQPLDPVPFGSAAFNDAQGNLWQYSGAPDESRIWYGDPDVRFVGEIASLPNRFSLGLRDKWVPITANGVLRRYGQGKSPAASGLRSFTLDENRVDALAAYYPLAGEEGTVYSLNLAPMNFYLKTQFYPESYPGPQNPVYKYGVDMGSPIGSGMELNATGSTSYMRGDVGTGDRNVAFDFVFQSPALGVLTVQMQDYDLNLWDVVLNTEDDDGTAQVHFTDPNLGPIGFLTTAVLPELQDGALHHCRLQITTTGANSAYKLFIDGVEVASGNNPGYIWRGTSLFRLYYTRYVNQTVMNLAHLTVWANANAAEIPSAADATAAALGYAGDTAADRMTRVADDGGIPLVIVGDPADTMRMGTLNEEPRLTQIRDAEAADMGILYESRDVVSLEYRTRRSMVGQEPTLTLAFDGRQVKDPLEPVDDDQLTRNDVTATRRNGGSYRVVAEAGSMSVLDPPNGVGLYDDEVTVNVRTDAQLAGIAAWLVNRGTLDKARYPSVVVELASYDVDDETAAQVYACDIGDLLRITGAAEIGEYDDMDLLAVGYTETIGPVLGNGRRKSSFTFVCQPADLHKAALYGTARYDTGGSTLAAGVSSTATSLSLATAAGHALWTTDAAAFPLDLWVGGERVTVTGITGATSPQTATVVRSVNGVVKGHDSGAVVRLFDTPRYAL